jgi:hypothetical protein
LGARFYDPSLGRFLSRDPLGYGGGDPNLYRYCGNDPVNATGPSGTVAIALPVVAAVFLFVALSVLIVGKQRWLQ